MAGFLLRLSLHEAVMPLNIESDSQGGVEFIVPKLIKYLMKYDKLDLSSIIDRQ